ncbi:NAD(P)H-binding protein [Streptomyces sp. NEAU-Y11]|uniref:NAD(P)H-binding protein n=1 Tax=Streptomyces cucumeris TaxID=2962890 RepID=UPI0020C907A9|nr:NAD(P)H-binding protein [Streptomyces sp. NEAU-Y11]MCP9211401.1 NAD(P)H-binding protein [Streptomyces sp. NEAU-Y11]
MTTNLSHLLVLGGTGKTGRRVAAALRHRGLEPAVASRRGPVRFDWADRATWQPALTGIDAVYVVDSQTPGAPAKVRDFTAVAARAGVRRLVLLSARPWGEMGGDHLATEEAVRASGLRWTILRPTWFAQNFTELDFFASLLGQQGELRLPTGDGREPFVDLDDLADVAAEALTDDRHSGQTYVLSGPRSLSFAEAVGEIARATGRPLRFVPVTEEAYRADLVAAGYEDSVIDEVITVLRHIREERGATVTDGVYQALGRSPRDFSAYVTRTDFDVA